MAAARVGEQRGGRLLAGEDRLRAELLAEPLREAAHRSGLRAGEVEGEPLAVGGVRQRAQRYLVGVPLPHHVGMTGRHIDRLPGLHAVRDVREDAVAQVDRVVEADVGDPGAPGQRRVAEDPLAAEA